MNTIIISSLLFIGAVLLITYWPTIYLVIRHYVDDKSYYAKTGKNNYINADRSAFNGNWGPVIVAVAVLFLFLILLVL